MQMKIWERFKTLASMRPNLKLRRCWSTCLDCSQVWSETNTEFLSMVVTKNGTRYICDTCLGERELKAAVDKTIKEAGGVVINKLLNK